MAGWFRKLMQRRFDREWERSGIPADVRARVEKAGCRRPPEWYAGRLEHQRFYRPGGKL